MQKCPLLCMHPAISFVSVIIHDCAMHPNTRVMLVNGCCYKVHTALLSNYDINRVCMGFPKRWCCRQANGWFTLCTKFTFKGTSPTNHLCSVRQASKCFTTLPFTVFARRNFMADFLWEKCSFIRKTVTLHFWILPPVGSVETTYTVLLRLIRKPAVDFLLEIIQLFSLGVTAEVLWVNIYWKLAFLKGVGQLKPKFQVEGDVPYQPFFMSGKPEWSIFHMV